MERNIWIYILVMASVSYLIRVLPLVLVRRQIKNTFIRSFLYYVPYVTLSLMTFPAIMDATGSPYAGLAALVVGMVMAYFKCSLLQVAVACCGVVFYFGIVFGLGLVSFKIRVIMLSKICSDNKVYTALKE